MRIMKKKPDQYVNWPGFLVFIYDSNVLCERILGGVEVALREVGHGDRTFDPILGQVLSP